MEAVRKCWNPNLQSLISWVLACLRNMQTGYYRGDNIYNLIAVLNYNMNQTVKRKGSAIFIHIAKKNYKQTAGCIALKKGDLIKLLKKIKKNTRIKISAN